MNISLWKETPFGKEKASVSSPVGIPILLHVQAKGSSYYFKPPLGCQEQKVDDTHQDIRTQGSMLCVKHLSENYIIYQEDVILSRGSGDGANHIIQLLPGNWVTVPAGANTALVSFSVIL